MYKIFTKNLVIREFTLDDVSAYFKNNDEEQIKKYMPNHAHSDINKAREEIEECMSNYADMKMPCHFAIVKDNMLIGHIGIGEWDIDENNRSHEIEYAISKDYRGLNYGAEALKAFAPWCKNELGIDKVYALVNEQNIASCKALSKAGFTLIEMEVKNKKRNVYVFE